jgi:hypothetical protein
MGKLMVGAGAVAIGIAGTFALGLADRVDPFAPGAILGLVILGALELRALYLKRRQRN